MNMMTPIASEVRPDASILGSVTERAHRHAIRVHCSNCDEFEMACRVDLATMRDAATAAQYRCSDEAAGLLGEVVRLASNGVYAPLPASRLIWLRSACRLTIEAARAVERAVADRLSKDG